MKYLDQEKEFHDFSMTSTIFPKIHDFSMTSTIFPKIHDFSRAGNAFSISMTFHDRMNLTIVNVFIKNTQNKRLGLGVVHFFIIITSVQSVR